MRNLGKPPLTRTLALGSAFALLVTAAAWWLFMGVDEKRVIAYFDNAVGVYEGGDVRVLGVTVGEIESVTPQPKRVRVEMTVRRSLKIPADAGAVVISPSVVSGRFIQLTPVYRGGPTMQSGAVIPNKRTVTPVAIDEIYRSINELSKALGPKGANKDGALSELIKTSAANLKGNGDLISRTLRNLGKLGTTLAGSSDDFFATIDKLQELTTTLANNDAEVRRFNTQMRKVTEVLAGQRADLGKALAELAIALGKVENFVQENRQKLHSNVKQLNEVAKVLVKQQEALREVLGTAPLALSNLAGLYNAGSGTLATRAVINELNQPPLILVCELLKQAAPETGTVLDAIPSTLLDTCTSLQGGLESLLGGISTPAETLAALQQGKLPELPLPLADALGKSEQGGGR